MAENMPSRAHRARDDDEESPDLPPAPSHLSDESRATWRAVVSEWVLGADALPLLRAALECWDRYQAARAVLDDEGPVVVNPNSGHPHANPAHQVARDNLREWRQLWRQLGLEPPTEE